jgi:methionyl-tRNA synthetase
VMPRFAARLAAALGQPEPTEWPQQPELLPAGSRIDLARQVFFRAPAQESVVQTWLNSLVCEALQLESEQFSGNESLALLGMTSMQSIALQYQILDRTGLDVSIEQLLGEQSVAQLAGQLQAGMRDEQVAELAEARRG